MTIAIPRDDEASATAIDDLRKEIPGPLSKHRDNDDAKGNDNTNTNNKENTPFPNSKCNVANDGDKIAAATTRIASLAQTTTNSDIILARSRESLSKEISKQVLRHKLQKLRHLVLEGVISKDYLDHEIFYPKLLDMFDPQTVTYNGGVAKIKEWKISCYLEVMHGGVPCTNPHAGLLNVFLPLLETCDDLFMVWYKQQHACNNRIGRFRNKKDYESANGTQTKHKYKERKRSCKRLMTFVTRYTPAPGEQALLKHVDGAGKVDGSCVVALPVDRWSAPEEINSFYGHGGGLTFWDGREPVPEEENSAEETSNTNINDAVKDPRQQVQRRSRFRPREIHYDTRPGDIAFIDRAVWHQADPITKGTRWALVIFYKVTDEEEDVTDEQQER